MLRLKLIALLLLISTPIEASDESLWKYSLFHQKNENDPLETPKESPKPKAYYLCRCLHLEGMLISDSSEWVVWINGGKLLKSAQKPDLSVERLDREQVTFKWKLEDKTHVFTLNLHESYHASTQTVTKGGCS